MSLCSAKFIQYISEELRKLRAEKKNMETVDSINATYCPHVGIFGANLFLSDKDSSSSSTTSSLTESLSTTDSQSTLSNASSPKARILANHLPIPLPPVPTMVTTNGPCLGLGDNGAEEKVANDDTNPPVEVKLNGFLESVEVDTVTTNVLLNGDVDQEMKAQRIVLENPVPDAPASTPVRTEEASPVLTPTRSNGLTASSKKVKHRVTCSQCKTKSNLWRCLGLDCGLILCGARGKNHANSHFLENLEHVIHENVSSRKLWCNICNRQVFRDFRNRRSVPAIWFPRDDCDDFPPRGLYNIGNTCYMNAALQNIAAVAPLTSYLMGDTFHDDETRTRRVSGSYRMFLDELFGHVNSTYQSAVMPSRLLYSIRLAHPIFRGFHQHDSQEFLRLFMDTLARETKVPHFTFEEKPLSENQDCEHDSDAESFETADSGNGSSEGTTSSNGTQSQQADDGSLDSAMDTEDNPSSVTYPLVKVTMKSILDDVCNGQLESSVQCLSCHETSRRLEVFQDLSLPIPTRDELTTLHQREDHCGEDEDEEPAAGWLAWIYGWVKWFIWGPSPTIHECLGAFFSADELKGKNMYACEKCKKLRNGVKRCSLYRLPEVLCVHLKRFRMLDSSPNSSPLKISQFVKFPLDDLDVRPFLHPECPDRVTSYRLMGVICHQGSVGIGHYTAYIRKGETWYLTDDCRVTEVSVREVENCEAYVLFYHKWDTEQDEDETKRQLLATWAKSDTESQESSDDELKFHIISRKWLTQYMWGEEEIPLDNTDVVCPHGRLVPVDNLEMSATWVPGLVWEAIMDKYGGGPDLLSNEFCQTCAIAWKKYQRTTVQQRTTSCATSRSYSFSFNPLEGFQSQSQFLNNRRERRIRTISNESLGSNGTLPEWQ